MPDEPPFPGGYPTPVSGTPKPQPTTKALPAMTDRALLEDLARVTKTIASDVVRMSSDVGTLSVSVEGLTSQQTLFGHRLTLVEKRQDDADQRQTTHSGGAKELAGAVRAESSVNLKQDAILGTLVADLSEAKADISVIKTDLAQNSATTDLIKTAVTGVGGFLKQHPNVVTGIATLIAAVLGWAANHLAH